MEEPIQKLRNYCLESQKVRLVVKNFLDINNHPTTLFEITQLDPIG